MKTTNAMITRTIRMVHNMLTSVPNPGNLYPFSLAWSAVKRAYARLHWFGPILTAQSDEATRRARRREVSAMTC